MRYAEAARLLVGYWIGGRVMQELALADMVVLFGIGLASAMVAVAALSIRGRGPTGDRAGQGGSEPAGPVLLFHAGELSDASADIRTLFGVGAAELTWKLLHEALVASYPSFPSSPDVLPDRGRVVVPAREGLGIGSLLVECFGDTTRVVLSPDSLSPDSGLAEELGELREVIEAMSFPAWRTSPQGNVTWHNGAYAKLVRKVRGRDADLARPLFDPTGMRIPAGRKTRLSIDIAGRDNKLWYDVTRIEQASGELFFAADANAVVDAEIAQRNFVQTLAKTFAQLSIGLAIFDRNRQLALFNPALIDLTSLPADFLSARPTLPSFFDRLRDLRMMPEPKDYRGWRQQMADLLAAVADGRYQETWTLPSGSVYSVSGRPHPDGAVAFLFEDITAEITLTRRFRSELELGQAVLDDLDDAIAVFSSEGTLALSNRSFHRLWGMDPDRSFAQTTILDATRIWQDRCVPTPLWGELRDFIARREHRVEWSGRVALRSGEALDCLVSPIQNGATMVRFCRDGNGVRHGTRPPPLPEEAPEQTPA